MLPNIQLKLPNLKKKDYQQFQDLDWKTQSLSCNSHRLDFQILHELHNYKCLIPRSLQLIFQHNSSKRHSKFRLRLFQMNDQFHQKYR